VHEIAGQNIARTFDNNESSAISVPELWRYFGRLTGLPDADDNDVSRAQLRLPLSAMERPGDAFEILKL